MGIFFDQRDARAEREERPLERLPTDPMEAMSNAYEGHGRFEAANAIRYGLKEEYEGILDEIEKTTGQRFANPVGALDDIEDAQLDGPTRFRAQVHAINQYVTRQQAEHPELKTINPDEVWGNMVTKAKTAGATWAQSREYSQGWSSVTGFLGMMGSAMQEPQNIAAMAAGVALIPFTGGTSAAAVATTIGAGAGLNVAAEVVAEPGKRTTARVLDKPERDLGDLATDAAYSAVFGAVIEGGGVAVSKGVSAGYSKLRTLRTSEDPIARSNAIVADRAYETIVEDNPSAYSAKAAAAESGGNLAARNPNSSATGKYQFTEGTWNEFAKETGVPPVMEGQPDPRINEAYQEQQMAAYTRRSTQALQQAGYAADDTNLYLAHFLGQKGAVDFLNGMKAGGDVPVTNYVAAEAIEANKSVFLKKDGTPKTAQEFYQWAGKKMGGSSPTGLPTTHIANYDATMKALNDDAPVPDPQPIAGPVRAPHVEGLEVVDPKTIQVDAKTFQFKEGGDELGVTDRLKGVDKWEQDFAGITLVYEKADGTRFIADGHQRLGLAKRFPEAKLNARILREADGWTPEAVRVRAAVKNIAEGTGSPLDAARIMRAARDADLPPLPPTSALVRQGRALAELGDEPFMMVVNGVVPENYGAIVGRVLRDPKLQEAAIKVLNKTSPENATQAEAIVRQVGETEVTTQTQSTLFGDEQISESLFLERAKVMDASIKSLKKDKAVFTTLVNQAERIEGAGNRLSRETNLERMNQDAKVTDYIQKLASRKGPISDALTAAARSLKEGARPGDATREFLRTVRGYADGGMDAGGGGRIGGSMADSGRPLQPAEIKVAQELFEKQPVDFLDEQISAQVDEALANGSLSKDMDLFVEAGDTLAKKKVGAVLDDLEADQVLVRELTACVEGTTEAVA